MNWTRNSDLSLSHSVTRDLSPCHLSRGAKAEGKQPRPPSFADETTAPSLDHSDTHSSRQQRLCVVQEETISELQSDLLHKSHEIDRLRSALNIAAHQRSDLLKESELLRHTVAELKSLHRREVAELKAQLANECALRAAADRQLAEAYFTERPPDLRTQVERLACKLQTLEDRHKEQTTVNEGVKARLTSQRSKMKENYSPQSTERSRKSPHVHRRS